MTLLRAIRPGVTEETDAALAELVERFIDRLQGGEAVDPAAFAAEHPDHGSALLALLPAAAAMATLRRSALRDAAPEAASFRLEEDVLGDYRIVREVGRGGMGVVFEAEQVSLGRRVALKVLPRASALDPRQLARFRVEAQAAAALDHPHIVPIIAVGCERGVHYYAMRFIEGRSLAGVIADHRACGSSSGIGPREAARLAMQAAEALEHAHSLGILHRDVKPANLLIDPDGHLWVTDFGLARFLDGGDLTQTGDVLGTLRYLSPEGARGSRVLDPRSDVYGLGATLYELATLRPAFDGLDRAELLRRIAVDEPIAPRKLDTTIPRDLETILSRALAKEPDARYGSAGELADDLRRFLDDRPILARPPRISERAGRWARRHKAAVLTAVLALALVIVGLAVGAAALWRERARTRENLAVALAALDEFCLSTRSMEFIRDPERSQEVRALQIKALAIYERILLQNPGNPDARWAAARANHRVADLLAASPRSADADRAYRAADAHLEVLLRGDPSSPRLMRESADLLGDWGAAVVPLKPRSATPILRRALAAHERLAAGSPADVGHRKALARDCLELSKTIGIIRPDEAEEKERFQRRAVELRRETLDRSFASRADLAEAHGYLGHLLDATGRAAEGEAVMGKARALTRALEAEFSADPTYRNRLAALDALFAFPRYCMLPAKPAEALRACRDSIASRARLAADFPFVPEFRAELAWSHRRLSDVLADLGRTREAEAEGRLSVELFERLIADHPTVEHYRRWMALTGDGLAAMLERSGRPDEAVTLLRTVAARMPEDLRLKSRLARLESARPEDRGPLPSPRSTQ